MHPAAASDRLETSVPNIVVVDPRFDAYKPLATSARLGKLNLHFRSTGAEAVKLSRRLQVDAWLIADELDDMSGRDLAPLLQKQQAATGEGVKLALVNDAAPGERQRILAEQDAREAGADSLLSHPITFRDLEELLGLPSEERAHFVVPAVPVGSKALVALPIGVGAAFLAVAVLMMG
jgi:CheY-like chemotaxis protein